MDTFSTNLPLQLTSFIGREHEMAEVKRLLSTTRLLTLTGAGGSGKTRLALQAASDLLETFKDGVWLVEFASLSDPALVPQAVASVFDVGETAGNRLIERLTDNLRAKDLLLVLDNCEHLIEACARLTEALLRACPNLRILATSREALGIAGETSFGVPSLSLPDLQLLPPVENLAQYESIWLFMERAAAARSDFQLAQQNAFTVAQVCQRLDGMPLAIELAAARVKALSVEQIAARLDDRFRLLTGGSRTALPRHQTLQAAIDWSYDLLSEQERVLFRRLAVFAGGWTLEAAERICADDDSVPTPLSLTGKDAGGIGRRAVLDPLTQLVNKSLVVVEEQGGQARYRLLETIREYAHDILLESREDQAVRDRHLGFFLKFAEEAEAKLKGAEQKIWLERLEREYDNLRSALEWAIERDAELAIRLAWALARFFQYRAYLNEGREYLARLVPRTEMLGATASRARALSAAGDMALAQRDLSSARAFFAKSLAIAQMSEENWEIAYALRGEGVVARFLGDTQKARSLLEASLTMFRQLGDQWHVALVLFSLGYVVMAAGDHAQARALYEQSLAGYVELEDMFSQVFPLNGLGELARLEDDYQNARVLHAKCEKLDREFGNKSHLALTLLNLGFVAQHEGDYRRARVLFEESLPLCRQRGSKGHLIACVEGLAGVIGVTGKAEQAARLFGAGEVLREAIGDRMDAQDRIDYDRNVAAVRSQLNEPTFARAWAEGRTMTLDQAIESALAESAALAEETSPLLPESKAQPELRIFALGATRVYRGEHEISSSEWTYAKARGMFFYLLCHPSRTKEQVGVALWPDASPAQLRNNMKVTLYHLRRALGRPEWILFENDQYAFNRALSYSFDVEAFESKLAQARRQPAQALALLDEAVSLYQGEFLGDWAEGEWYLQRREELQQGNLKALLTLGRLQFAAKQYADAGEAYRKATAQDGYLEEAHRELMRCYARQGERGQALRHYQELVELMREELGAPPAPETKALYERLKRGEEI